MISFKRMPCRRLRQSLFDALLQCVFYLFFGSVALTGVAGTLPYYVIIPPILTQSAYDFLPADLDRSVSLLAKDDEEKKKQDFTDRFFFVWGKDISADQYCFMAENNANTCAGIVDIEKKTLEVYKQKTKGFNEFYELLDVPVWLQPIEENMHLSTFPNMRCEETSGCQGLVVTNVPLRVFPTSSPFYADYRLAGEGFPFDYMQLDSLWMGIPVLVIHKTQNEDWFLIQANGVLGWVASKNVLLLTSAQADDWKAAFTKYAVTPVGKKFTVQAGTEQERTFHQGSLLPANKLQMWVPELIENGKFKKVFYKKGSVIQWPVAASPNNFAMIFSALLDMPYRWGSMDFHSDCSSLVRRVYATFGLWLPRSPANQGAYGGLAYSLPDKSEEERKLCLFKESADTLPLVPYLTLLTFGDENAVISHVAIYLGQHLIDGKRHGVLFHSLWGLMVAPAVSEKSGASASPAGCAGIGHTSLTTISVGENIAPALRRDGYSLTTLWNMSAFNVTLLNQSAQSVLETGKVKDFSRFLPFFPPGN